jgi:sec-independent protein translocase protein TatA
VNVGPFQILIIALVFLVLFGRGRVSEMMGDFGKGVKSFRKGLADEETPVRLDGLSHDTTPAGETIAEPAPEQSRNYTGASIPCSASTGRSCWSSSWSPWS